MLLLASVPAQTGKTEITEPLFHGMMPKEREGLTIAIDGKTIRSTRKMGSYESPMHIVSAQVSELGMTFAQKCTDSKSNEIPVVQELLEELDTSGCLVVADALDCQKKTVAAVIFGKGDYLLCAKDNHETLKNDIEEYAGDETLREGMETAVTVEKDRGGIEKRTAYATTDTSWLSGREEWEGLKCIGAVHTEFEEKGKKSSGWHYYISSRELTARELLHHARMEWCVETMHWLLDVYFGEDGCCVEDKNIQQNLNMLRKLTINLIKKHKENSGSKRAISKIMFDCLLDTSYICKIMEN